MPTNCLSVFDHFVKLALKALIMDLLYKPQFQNYLQVAVDKIFKPKCISCDAEDITASGNRKALHVLAVI